MSEFSQNETDCYSDKYLIQKLKDYFNDNIVVTEGVGQITVLSFRTCCDGILRDHWKNHANDSDTQQRQRILDAAAAIILEEAKSVVTDLGHYDILDVNNLHNKIPPSLKYLLDKIIKVNKTSTGIDVKIVAIAHAIMSAIRPRSFISELFVAFGVWTHMKFGSRLLIDMTSALGFSVSYSEVQKFELSATKTKQTSQFPGAFIQTVFDNADININTLTGKGTFHSLGGVATVAPSESVPPASRIVRCTIKETADVIGEYGKVPIHFYQKPAKSGLRKIAIKKVNTSDLLDMKDHITLHTISFCRSILHVSPCPTWSGFMQLTVKQELPCTTSKIVFLPFINLSPSNPTSILSALKYAENLCERNKQRCVIATFDQPLQMKAADIVAALADEHELENVIIRLGGFHLLMSFLGAVGYIMSGSGLEELWSQVYAPNSVPHLLSGHAFARSMRAHILTAEALTAVTINEIQSNIENEILEANALYVKLIQSEISYTEVVKNPAIQTISESVDKAWVEASKVSRTSKLWKQYLEMNLLIRLFVTAERTGDWKLHMYCVNKMLPYFHAAGHLNYAKSAHLYYQSMQSIKEKMNEVEYNKFVKCGYFTVRRDERLWSGVWTDMIIEQVLMRAIKSSGGLSRGRGVTDSVLTKYIYSLPACTEYTEPLETWCGVHASSSDQHVEEGKSRQKTDLDHLSQFFKYLQDRSPLTVKCAELKSISTGVIADERINCDEAETVGKAAQDRMIGNNFADIHIKRQDKVLPLAAINKSINMQGDIIPVNTQQIINRMLCCKLDEEELRQSMCHELSPVCSSLFDDSCQMRKGTKSKLQDAIISHCPCNSECVINESVIVIVDGGFLLHKVPWQRVATYKDVIDNYVNYIRVHYATKSSNTTVVFDGYGTQTTKNYTQIMRYKKLNCHDIDFILENATSCTQAQFLSSSNNKRRLIDKLSEKLIIAGIAVIQAEGDADTAIATTAIDAAGSGSPVVVVGNDTDVLVLLTARASPDLHIKYVSPAQQREQDKIFNISEIKKSLKLVAKCLLFLHAISGCDTTSAPYRKGKTYTLNKMIKDPSLQNLALLYYEADADKKTIITAGEKFMLALYNSNENTLNDARYYAYHRMTSQTSITSKFELASLPPTSAAAEQHSLRAYLQVQQWLGRNPPPEEWGWKLSRSGELQPIITTQPPAPDFVLKMITCSCTGDCTGRCSCKTSGLFCGPACTHCQGIACFNHESVANEDDDNMGVLCNISSKAARRDESSNNKFPAARKRRTSTSKLS